MNTFTDFPEPEYRKEIQKVYALLEKALADVDPDLAETQQSNGVLTLTFADKSRCIISGQPSVRQLWVALAALGTAYHFNFDSKRGQWVDDKGRGIELIQYMKGFLEDKIGSTIEL
jgi:CyaY protein